MMQIRASSVGKLMTYPEKDTLADGAMSYVYELASQILLDWQPELDNYAISKGKQCEDDSIALLNQVTGNNFDKNSDRITNDLFTGEWDIYDPNHNCIIDIKSAYSKKTFPIILKESDKKLYEWQLDCYMLLKDADSAMLAYCLVDTPPDLIKRGEPENWHKVSHIAPSLRVTQLFQKRSVTREKQMIAKAKLAQKALMEILDSRGYDWEEVDMPDDFLV
jgi:hypothetical protein